MNRSKRQFVCIVIGCLAPFTSIPHTRGSDDTSPNNFKTQLDALLSVPIHSTDDLKPALAFVKAHGKDPDLVNQLMQSSYFAKVEDNFKYFFNPDTYGENIYLSTDGYLVRVLYDTTNRKVVDDASGVTSKKTKLDFEIKRK